MRLNCNSLEIAAATCRPIKRYTRAIRSKGGPVRLWFSANLITFCAVDRAGLASPTYYKIKSDPRGKESPDSQCIAHRLSNFTRTTVASFFLPPRNHVYFRTSSLFHYVFYLKLSATIFSVASFDENSGKFDISEHGIFFRRSLKSMKAEKINRSVLQEG